MATTATLFTESAEGHLDDLLHRICEKLQITPTNYALAEQRYKTIGEILDSPQSPLARYRPIVYPQGSMRIGTTVRPIGRQEYDLDMVCEFQVDPRPIANPTALLDAVEKTLSTSSVHKGRLERKNRCIRISYANEFHLDVLPACPDGSGRPGCLVVPDQEARDWKASNPRGFAQWFLDTAERRVLRIAAAEDIPPQEAAGDKAILKLVVQLLKRARDITFSKAGVEATPSVVITTIAAQHYGGESQLSHALQNLLGRILGAAPMKPRLRVLNPTNPDEDFSERWNDPAAYNAFLEGLRNFARTYAEALTKRGPALAAALEKLFGEETRMAFKEQAQEIYERKEQGRLGVLPGRGTLVAPAAAGAIRTVPNTFYGSEEK